MPHTWRNGKQKIPNANTNRQHNGTKRSQKHCNEKTKFNGHEVPLVKVPKESMTLSPFWGTRHQNKGDYLTKHHALIHHQAIKPEFLTPKFQLKLLSKHVEWKKSTALVWYTDVQTGLTAKELDIQQDSTASLKRTCREYPKSHLTHIHGTIHVCTHTYGGSTGST